MQVMNQGNNQLQYEVLIIGGGFAGLSGAIWLGRYHRSAAVISKGPVRNAGSSMMHGYPGFDGHSPAELLKRMQTEAAGYGTSFIEAWAEGVTKTEDGFEVQTDNGTYTCRRLLIASGTHDNRPYEIPGFKQFLGETAWHCPSCDGHEFSDKQIALLGWHEDMAGYAEEFLPYTEAQNITIYTHGHDLDPSAREQLTEHGMQLITDTIESLQGDGDRLRSIQLVGGTTRKADVLFYNIEQKARLELFEQLGCKLTDGAVQVNQKQETSVEGVYAAGDITPFEDLVVVACSTGTLAASSIHESLDPATAGD